MASYSAYKWVPWQLFCSVVDSSTFCFKTTPTGAGARTTPFATSVALNGIWFASTPVKCCHYIPTLPGLDITMPVNIGIEFFVATDGTAGTAQFGLRYAAVDKGPGGTDFLNPAMTALTVPQFVIPATTTGWLGRMFTIAELEIPGYTFTAPYQGLLLEVENTSGGLFTTSKIAFEGLSVYYSSTVMVN
jgi:hypothetical protein